MHETLLDLLDNMSVAIPIIGDIDQIVFVAQLEPIVAKIKNIVDQTLAFVEELRHNRPDSFKGKKHLVHSSITYYRAQCALRNDSCAVKRR